jgi:starch-binding outer membrane protein, SusD/RagB family
MENKFLNIILILGIILLNACELDEEPYGFYSENNFYKSAADAEAAITYAYDALTFLEYSRGVYILGDLSTDECFPKTDQAGDQQDINNWKVTNFPTNRGLMNYFKYAYIAINRSNAVLENIPLANFDENQKNNFMGEAYFLRAWNYFNLVKNFGLVPVHKTLVKTLDQTAAPMAENLDEIYNLIFSDCKKAIELLEINQRTGRADKVAAQSLAAKAYLHIASSKSNNAPLYSDMGKDIEIMYDSAAYFANQVINNQTLYGFQDDLLDIFDVENPKGSEHIFLMSMDRSGTIEGDYSKISKLFIPYVAGGDIFLDNGDGTFTKSHDGWSVYQTKESFYEKFEGSDKRGNLLLVDKVYDAQGNIISQYPGGLPYRFSRKYVDPLFEADKTSTKPFLIRFSDIALIYAEAVGPTPEAYDLVNFIRNRAGVGNLPPDLGLNSFRERIWEERGLELMYEGNRLYDLRRFNRVSELVEEASGLSDQETLFYPIPKVEIDLNQGL